MSLGGIKKQWNKANQYVAEKISSETEKTKMEDEFIEMERKVDVTYKAITDVMSLTKELLQPNPTIRAKMNMMNTYQKIQGKQRDNKYPQAEGSLGECMNKYGVELGNESNFGTALREVGEAFGQLSEIKDSLDVGVKQDFLDPLQQLCDKDIKEVMHHRKKLSGRRLDYDYKRKKGTKFSAEEIQLAEDKLNEILLVADTSMSNLLNNDVEQVRQLASLVETQLEYHRQSADILDSLHISLQRSIDEINQRPEMERRKHTLRGPSLARNGRSPSDSPVRINHQPLPAPPSPTKAAPPSPTQPCCRALYDFEPENEGELPFSEGDVLTLVSRVDDNWFEGLNKEGTIIHENTPKFLLGAEYNMLRFWQFLYLVAIANKHQ